MKKLVDGDYTIPLEVELDKGHGIEAVSTDIVIYIHKNDIDEVIGYGIHHVTELDVDWHVDISDEKCLELLEKHHPEAFQDYTRDELEEIAAEAKFEQLGDR